MYTLLVCFCCSFCFKVQYWCSLKEKGVSLEMFISLRHKALVCLGNTRCVCILKPMGVLGVWECLPAFPWSWDLLNFSCFVFVNLGDIRTEVSPWFLLHALLALTGSYGIRVAQRQLFICGHQLNHLWKVKRCPYKGCVLSKCQEVFADKISSWMLSFHFPHFTLDLSAVKGHSGHSWF